MIDYEKGMLAKSLAGHDAGRIYCIADVDDTYVYLVDGRIRTLDNPKKKKKKHVQLIGTKYNIASADDAKIKEILKKWRNENVES